MNEDRPSHFEAACLRSPPANGGYAGGRPAYKSCAPMRASSQEESAKITGVLRLAEPHRSRAPDPGNQLRSNYRSDELEQIVHQRVADV